MAKQSTKTYGETQSQTINIISENTSIKGDIISGGDLRIDGELNGNVKTEGRLVVGAQGKLEGEINCNNIEVSGYVKGKIIAKELLTMKSSARIFGEITAGKLSVEPGSLFTGSCSMGDAKEINEKTKPTEQKKI
jgi:cytoskeletal protein CcmA (bactofilin family)